MMNSEIKAYLLGNSHTVDKQEDTQQEDLFLLSSLNGMVSKEALHDQG